MKFGVVNKSAIVNKFVLHILQRNITHLAVITRKTNIKLGILKEGDWKRAVKHDKEYLLPGKNPENVKPKKPLYRIWY